MIRSPLLTGGSSNLDGELAPPVVRGLTSLPEHSWQNIQDAENGESAESSNPIRLLSEASALFARAAKVDPMILRTMLELGGAIAKTLGGPAAQAPPELFGAMPAAPPPMMAPPPSLPMPGPPMGGPPMGSPPMGPPPGIGLPPPALPMR